MFTFGAPVTVDAEVLPVYARIGDQFARSSLHGSMWVSHATGECQLDPTSFSAHGKFIEPGEGDTWPGEPIPEGDHLRASADPGLEPTGEQPRQHRGAHRRLRRLPLAGPNTGVVVGVTRRQEGVLVGFMRDPDDGPPQLSVRRTVLVLQVALDTGSCAHVVDAHPDDVKEQP